MSINRTFEFAFGFDRYGFYQDASLLLTTHVVVSRLSTAIARHFEKLTRDGQGREKRVRRKGSFLQIKQKHCTKKKKNKQYYF